MKPGTKSRYSYRVDMKDDFLAAFRGRRTITIELLQELRDYRGAGLYDVRGKPVPKEAVLRSIESRWRRREKVGISSTIVLPLLPGEHESPTLSAYLSRVDHVNLGETQADPPESVMAPVPAFQRAEPPYATVFGQSDRTGPDMDRVVDALKRVSAILDCEFAAADAHSEFAGAETIENRLWGLTYLGPERVNAIGKDCVSSSPAYKVEFDDYGGSWVWLAALPFATSKEKERRRTAVERHLALSDRFSAAL